MFCKEKEYPLIALNSLAGFREDKAAARRFAYRFLPWSLSCVAAFVGVGASLAIPAFGKRYDPVPQVYMVLAGGCFALCFGLFVVTWHRMVATVPTSSHSGQPMEVYRLEDTKDRNFELIYLCRKSRTYFRIVFKCRGD
jgi:hypothetical protein